MLRVFVFEEPFSVKLRLKPCFSDLLDRILIASSALHHRQPARPPT